MAGQSENRRRDILTQEMRDNVTNQQTEEHVPSAINMVLANRVQSYDEFMESFVYLKKEDVEDFIPASDDYPDCIQSNFDSRIKSGESQLLEEIREQTDSDSVEKRRKVVKEEDDLETEVLIEGSNSLTTPRERHPEQKYVQVDNFVDEVYSDDESDDPLLEDVCELLEDSKNTTIKGVKLTKDFKEDMEKVSLSDSNIPDNQGLKEDNLMLPSNLPGEADDAEETLDTTVKANETRLKVGSTDINQDPAQEAQTDEVQPFELDPNFDYDNVKLTPKWGPNDPSPPEG